MNIKYIRYNSINEFLNKINVSEEVKHFGQSNNKTSSMFNDTKTFQEAYDNTKYGKNKKIDLDIFNKFNKDFSKFENKIKIRKDVVGQQPIVANYIIGNPRSMYRKAKTIQKKKILNIGLISGSVAFYSTSEMVKSAINNFKIIKVLESKGFKCNVNVLIFNEIYGDGYHFEEIKIKDASERFNIIKMVNPLCSSSFFRRIWFRHQEVVYDDYRYGKTLYWKEAKEVIKKSKIKYDYVLPNAQNTKINLSDEMLINDFEKTLEAYCLK